MKTKILALLMVLVFLTAGCSTKTEAPKTTALPDSTAEDRQVNAYLKLDEGFKTPEEAVKYYRESILPIVKEADALMPGLSGEAEAYAKAFETKPEEQKDPEFAGMEKSINISFGLFINKELDEIEKNYSDTAASKESFRKAKTYYRALEPVSKRRGNFINDDNKFYNEITGAFNDLEKAIDSKNLDSIKASNEKIKSTLTTVYFLSVVFEASGMSDEKIKAEKVVEGRVYFKAIKNSASDPGIAQVIETEFAKTAKDCDYKLIKEKLKAAYPELSSKYSNKF